jgi:hypothetical protein
MHLAASHRTTKENKLKKVVVYMRSIFFEDFGHETRV